MVKTKKEKLFFRNCPNPKNNAKCLKIIGYVKEKRMINAEKDKRICKSCNSYGQHTPKSEEHKRQIGLGQTRAIQEGRKPSTKGKKKNYYNKQRTFFTECPNRDANPNCLKRIGYVSESRMLRAEKGGYLCKSCKMKGKMVGNKNPMYGKRYTKEQRKRMSELYSGICNPMYGRNVYDVWIEKYGVEEANRRLNQLKAKHSKNNSGERNPMFGKPSPNLCARGISGYHIATGLHFRSSCEANFIINNPDLCLISAESEQYCSNYSSPIDGKRRSYLPDFFDRKSKTLFEVKNVNWRERSSEEKIEITDCKIAAAEKICRERGWKYFVYEIGCIQKRKMFKLRDEGVISFDPKYEKQFQKWLNLNVSPR